MLHEWGRAKSPYPSYYGQFEAEDIGKWWGQFGQLLFVRNLRKFTGKTDVNDGIMRKPSNKDPSKFWYFNNGITVLCSRLKKKAIGGSKRTSGVLSCEGLSIVNGAQTVGCIGEAYKKSPQLIQQARVDIRFISTSNAPESFSKDLTRAANTQNRINFTALDPELQNRLRRELYLENGKLYSYKSGGASAPTWGWVRHRRNNNLVSLRTLPTPHWLFRRREKLESCRRTLTSRPLPLAV